MMCSLEETHEHFGESIMNAHIKLGRIFDIQVGLHYSWLIIAPLVTLSLNNHFGATNPQWGVGVIWATDG
jgi:hypothetical protein